MRTAFAIAIAFFLAAGVGLVLSLAMLLRRWRVEPGRLSLDAMRHALVPFMVATTIATMAVSAIARPWYDWDDARFATSMMVARGLPLYSESAEGPQLPTIYGPLASLMYLPATLASHPVPAMIIAGFIAQIAFFAPLAGVCLRSGSGAEGSERSRVDSHTLLLACIGVLSAAASPSLAYSGFRIHVDAPALGFAGLACLLASDPRRFVHDPRTSWAPPGSMILSSLFCALALFTKQTLVPLPAAIVMTLALTQGIMTAVRYAFVFLVVAGVGVGILGSTFGFREMWFHMFVIPSSHPLAANPLPMLLRAADVSLPFVSIPLTLVLLRAAFDDVAVGRTSGRIARWLPFVLAAACCLPTAALGFAKVGGDVNNWSFVIYFELLAAIIVAKQRLDDEDAARSPRVTEAFLLAVALTLNLHAFLAPLPRTVATLRKPCSAAIVYEYCRQHPGRVYFPWHPAAVFAAEGRLHHHYYQLFDRHLAGRPITLNHAAAHIPPEAEAIFIEEKYKDDFSKYAFDFSAYFPDFVPSEAPLSPPIGIPGRVLVRRKASPND